MTLFDYIKLKYEPVFNTHIYLNNIEWTSMIKTFCSKLAEKPVGNILESKLLEFIEKGYQIIIANNDYPISRTIFPKIRYVNKTTVLIVIPSVPYFTSNYTINRKLLEDIGQSDINENDQVDNINRVLNHYVNICECLPTNKLSDKDAYEYKFLIGVEPVPPFIHFAHELVHCLRFFSKFNTEDCNEEDATIYGLKTNVLNYKTNGKTVYITENTIRREWGLNPRVNHDSVENFCHEVHSTYPNAKKFSKKDFFN
jgi:hypothetical protein